MIRPIFPLLAICLLAPALSQASEKDPLEIAYEKAQTVLEDRSFYEKWKDAKTFRDAKEADGVAETARAELRELERAMKDVEAYCSKRFFVNSCVKEGRDKSNDRRREINQIVIKVNDYRHALNVERLKERRIARPASKPMDIEPATVKEPSKPMNVAPKTPRAPSEPMDFNRKERSPSEPMSLGDRRREASEPVTLSNDRAAEVEARRAEAAAREAQEEANLAAYEEKQARAKARQEKAEAMAEKRREKRLERSRELNKTIEERRAAQERLEERRRNKDSGLEGYF